MKSRYFDPWAVTAAAAVLMAITMGSRYSFGLLISPLNTATGLGIATISLAAAVSQLVWGMAQPFVGAAADRFGTARVIGAGGVAAAAATALVTMVGSAAGLILAFALLAVATAAMSSNALLLAAVNRDAPQPWRGLAVGIVGAGASVGQLILAPAMQALISTSGWMAATWGLAALALLALPLSRAFGRSPASAPEAPPPAPAASASGAPGVRAALLTPSFWLVTGGFFVCGFHVAFLVAHMPGQIELCGLEASVSGVWIAIVGACNAAGSLAAGAAIQRMSAKRLLIGLYALRAIGVAVFLALPKTEFNVLAFAVWMGLTYMATLPPTSGLVGKLFGTDRFATLFGIVMLVHQIGAFLGVWMGGIALETSGSLDWIWRADIALALAAVALHVPLREPVAVANAGTHPSVGSNARRDAPRLTATTIRTIDGRAVAIRRITPEDRGAVERFVRELTPESRRRRFHIPVREISQRLLDAWLRPNRPREPVFVGVEGAGARARIVAMAQLGRGQTDEQCEIALVVADDLQNQGLGSRMLSMLIDAAQEAGFRVAVGDVLRENRAMLALARRAGFDVGINSEDPALMRIIRMIGKGTRAITRARFGGGAGGSSTGVRVPAGA